MTTARAKPWQTSLPRWLRFAAVGLLGLAIFGWVARTHYYPHGIRTAWLQVVQSALLNYADEHGGWLPDKEQNGVASLQLLTPEFLSKPDFLAGLTGAAALAREICATNGSLTAQHCTWVYRAGLRKDDDPGLAILWESSLGYRWDGRRSAAQTVALLDGSVRSVPTNHWEYFIAEQQRLFEQALLRRTTKEQKR